MAADPATIVCIGMAGSGKTTFMQRIVSHLHQKKAPPYVVNLDPAVHTVPFESNIDIRDSINYKEVMKQYNLGPNGGILTSLNLFATKVDQIINLLEKRTKPEPSTNQTTPPKTILVDTPGQIEVFVWSASGAILLDSLASAFPTVIAYIIDTPRTTSTSTFMSNMLYACSILYKTKLPMILVFNKTDVEDASFAHEWMTDFEKFQEALRNEEQSGSFGGLEGGDGVRAGGSGYMGSLLNSMSLVLEEFYRHLSVVDVSSMTGEGVEDFFEAVQEKVQEYENDYKPVLLQKQKEREQKKQGSRLTELKRLMKDMEVDNKSKKGTGSSSRQSKVKDGGTISDQEDDTLGHQDENETDTDEADDENVGGGRDTGGLQERYRKTLSDQVAEPGKDEENSFARYLASSRIS